MKNFVTVVMTKIEGIPTPQSTRWGHINTGTAGGTADGSLTPMAQQMAMLKACLTDSDGNAKGRLTDSDGSAEGRLGDSDGSAEGSLD
jgi:hypothetical protein